jgi:hypothetical protein
MSFQDVINAEVLLVKATHLLGRMSPITTQSPLGKIAESSK